MQRLRDLLLPTDRVRYLAWRASRSKRSAVFRVRGGPNLFLRPPPATDIITAYEIFVAEVYRSVGPQRDESIERVVDVGANVGFSVLYWAARYPKAHIIAFEPHPVHVASLRRNLELNGVATRVTVHAAAACAKDGTVLFSDAEHCSTVVDGAGPGTLNVPAIDFFARVGAEPIGLLKMDIEGGEYDLLRDERFARLKAQTIVLEWHRSAAEPDGREWCARRLRELGYAVATGLWTSEVNGLLWAFRAS